MDIRYILIICVILIIIYTIKINKYSLFTENSDINANNNSYKGDQEIIYTNNSLDTLNKVFFHLYFNAFRKGSDMAVRLNNGDDINTRFI